MTSLLKKYVISKNGHFMPIMAIYEITEAQTNLILVSTPNRGVVKGTFGTFGTAKSLALVKILG